MLFQWLTVNISYTCITKRSHLEISRRSYDPFLERWQIHVNFAKFISSGVSVSFKLPFVMNLELHASLTVMWMLCMYSP